MILVQQPRTLDTPPVPIAELKVRLRELVRIRDQHRPLDQGPIRLEITKLVQQISSLEQPTGAS